VAKGHGSVALLLIAQGAAVDVRDKKGQSPRVPHWSLSVLDLLPRTKVEHLFTGRPTMDTAVWQSFFWQSAQLWASPLLVAAASDSRADNNR